MEQPKAKNYIPGSIEWSAGFLGPKGDRGYFMKADYEKAKGIIESLKAAGRNIDTAEMGLDGDWRENSCIIYNGGGHMEYDAYSRSQWAEPIMIVNFTDSPSETYSVWVREEKTKS